MKRQVIIGFAISLACLVYVLRDVDFAELWKLTLEVNPLYYLWVNVSLALSMWVRSYRWRLLLSPVKACRIEPLYSANLIGFMANDLLPARLGEFVRAYAAGRLEGIPASTTLATIVVERVLDGLCMLLVLFLALLFADPSAQAGAFNVAYLRGAGFALLALYLGVLAVSVGLWRMPEVTTKLITGIAGRISSSLAHKAAELLETFNQGLAVLGQSRHLPLIILQSLGVWLFLLGMYVVFLPAVGLPVSLLMGAMALAGGALGAAVPAGPGYIGTFQLAIMWALMLVGADEQQALVYSLLFWAAQYFPITIAGLITMWRKGMKFSFLKEAGKDA